MKSNHLLSIVLASILFLPPRFAVAQELPLITQDQEELIRARKTQEEPDEQTKEILGQFANVVNGFLMLIQDPNNKQHVAKSVTHMIASATQLVIAATKSLHHESFSGEEPEKTLDETLS